MRTSPVGQHVQQEAAQELDGIKRHELGAGVVGVIFPLEADSAVFERAQAMVGNGDAMGVAGQILQHAARSTERWLDMDHPIDVGGLVAESLKGDGFREGFQLAVEAQIASAKSPAQRIAGTIFGSDD